MKIFVNPGHAPNAQPDPGATGFGLKEALVVADISKLLVQKLKQAGYDVRSLQSDELGDIPGIANDWGANVFVSIHCNAANAKAKGTETLVYSLDSEGAVIAEAVQDSIVSSLKTVDRGVRERPDLCVLRATDMPAILVETAFIDNKDDNQLLRHPQLFADAIFKGLMNYLGDEGLKNNEGQVVIPSVNKLSPKGIPYDPNDIQYLLDQGYTMADALSFLDTTDKYSNSDIQRAVAWAESRVGTTGYGPNGCTAFVRDFLLQANHYLGKLMQSGVCGNLMWVPNLVEWAKANNMWKEPEEGCAVGDVVIVDTDYDFTDADHSIIAAGDGEYYGNSSSRNKIVKGDIADDFGSEWLWGYIATGTGSSQVVDGMSSRPIEEAMADAGPTSGAIPFAPNGTKYSDNDIKYLLSKGYTLEDAIAFLSKDPKYTTILRKAPNGKIVEYNDYLYLKNKGYTDDAIYNILFQADKYRK